MVFSLWHMHRLCIMHQLVHVWLPIPTVGANECGDRFFCFHNYFVLLNAIWMASGASDIDIINNERHKKGIERKNESNLIWWKCRFHLWILSIETFNSFECQQLSILCAEAKESIHKDSNSSSSWPLIDEFTVNAAFSSRRCYTHISNIRLFIRTGKADIN